jgi:hypothetical protein
MSNLKLIYENIILTESRVSKARERYSEISDEVFDFVVENDPSGNQKYLDWVLGVIADSEDKEKLKKVLPGFHEMYLIPTIKFFHDNIHLYSVKDINFYKNLKHLYEVTVDVKETKKEIDRKKLAKKEKTVVYSDDNWLVISPKSWESSCEYGAGTKWCIASKTGPSNWEKETKNSTFFYIINRNLPESNPLYKVAYRRIGRKDRFELWNAEDIEFSTTNKGSEYLSELPMQLLWNADDYHRQYYPETEGDDLPEEILEDPKMYALYNLFGDEEIMEENYNHYGLTVYNVVSEGDFAVGTEEEAEDAHKSYWESFADDVGVDNIYGFENYLTLRDEESFIDDEVGYYINDLGDAEILEISGYEDEHSDVESEIEDLEYEIGSLEDELIDLEGEDELDEMERIENKIESLQSKIEELQTKLSDIIEEARSGIEDAERSEWKSCLRDGVYECFVKYKGWFGSAEELLKANFVIFDDDEFVSDMLSDADRGNSLASYDGDEQESTDLEGNTFYIYKI